jgi:hypothetical protein
MVRDTLQAAFCKTQQKHAHPTFVTLQMLEQIRFSVWRGALKIRVSAVRFCPRPPVHTASTQVLAVFYFVDTRTHLEFLPNGYRRPEGATTAFDVVFNAGAQNFDFNGLKCGLRRHAACRHAPPRLRCVPVRPASCQAKCAHRGLGQIGGAGRSCRALAGPIR